jgi:hypothetical protein
VEFKLELQRHCHPGIGHSVFSVGNEHGMEGGPEVCWTNGTA